MAVLSDADRLRLANGIMRFVSDRREPVGYVKADIRTAVANIDSWIDSQGTTINNTFPVGFRTTATSGQKALVVALVAMMRYDPALVKALITGGID